MSALIEIAKYNQSKLDELCKLERLLFNLDKKPLEIIFKDETVKFYHKVTGTEKTIPSESFAVLENAAYWLNNLSLANTIGQRDFANEQLKQFNFSR